MMKFKSLLLAVYKNLNILSLEKSGKYESCLYVILWYLCFMKLNGRLTNLGGGLAFTLDLPSLDCC